MKNHMFTVLILKVTRQVARKVPQAWVRTPIMPPVLLTEKTSLPQDWPKKNSAFSISLNSLFGGPVVPF